MTTATVETDLLTTGEAAKVLGVTPQHVRNLCDRGLLPYVHVGSHRRIRRVDFDALRFRESNTLRREQLRSLWLHQAIAGKLVAKPERVLNVARLNLTHLRTQHPSGVITKQFDTWQRLLDGPLVDLLNVLTSSAPFAIELRQNTPFAGVLTEHERSQVLNSFNANYRKAS